MQIIVKKFGGTSLADLSRITRAISLSKKSLNTGNSCSGSSISYGKRNR